MWVNLGDLSVAGSETGLKRVQVIVTSPTGDRTELTAIRSIAGPSEWASTTKTYTSRAHIELQPSEDTGRYIETGVAMLNEPRTSIIDFDSHGADSHGADSHGSDSHGSDSHGSDSGAH